MNPALAIFWAVVSGATYQACYKEGTSAQVCVPANGTGTHDFTNLKFDTDYVFTYKENGVESGPMPWHTKKKVIPAPNIAEK